MYRGAANVYIGKYKEAEKDLFISLNLDSINHKVYFYLGMLKIKTNNNLIAIHYLSKSIEINNKAPKTYDYRALAKSNLLDYKGAIEDEDIDLEEGQEVDLLVFKKTELGYKVIINNLFEGLIYHNEIFKTLNVGDSLKGYVKPLREDGKIDLILQKAGYKNIIEPSSALILDLIKKNNGFLSLNDKSSPDDIKRVAGMSKKSFKKTIGTLYKQKLILIEKDGLYLTKNS